MTPRDAGPKKPDERQPGHDEWRARLALDLLGGEENAEPVSQRITFAPEGATAMEIAFGKARSELTYVLELGRAHHLPVMGSVVGDEIWIRMGEAKVSFRLDRQTTTIHATASGDDSTLAWDAKLRAIVTSGGKAVDMEFFVRDAIDATVKTYKKDL